MTLKDNRLYKFTYEIKPYPEGISAKEIRETGSDHLGAADALIIFSIVRGESGNRDQMMMGLDGATMQQCSAAEEFKTWSLWASGIMEKKDLPIYQRWVAEICFKLVRAFIVRDQKLVKDTCDQIIKTATDLPTLKMAAIYHE